MIPPPGGSSIGCPRPLNTLRGRADRRHRRCQRPDLGDSQRGRLPALWGVGDQELVRLDRRGLERKPGKADPQRDSRLMGFDIRSRNRVHSATTPLTAMATPTIKTVKPPLPWDRPAKWRNLLRSSALRALTRLFVVRPLFSFIPSDNFDRKHMKTEIKEYVEGLPVEIFELNGRLIIQALNECGSNGTRVDLTDVVNWVICNRPELIAGYKIQSPDDKS